MWLVKTFHFDLLPTASVRRASYEVDDQPLTRTVFYFFLTPVHLGAVAAYASPLLLARGALLTEPGIFIIEVVLNAVSDCV